MRSINVCYIGLVHNFLVSWFLTIPDGSFEFYSFLGHEQQETNGLYLNKKLPYFFSRRSILFCISTKKNAWGFTFLTSYLRLVLAHLLFNFMHSDRHVFGSSGRWVVDLICFSSISNYTKHFHIYVYIHIWTDIYIYILLKIFFKEMFKS